MSEQGISGVAVQNETAESRAETSRNLAKPPEVLDVMDAARFWSRVEVRMVDQCWPWRYGVRDDGYGEYRYLNGARENGHRVAYRIANGPIAAELVIRHKCDNRVCCNPAHLEEGDHADNVADRVARERSARGEANGRSKLNVTKVKLMRDSPLSDFYFANRFDVDLKTIRDARSGKTWAHV
jgi:hypothetical protein